MSEDPLEQLLLDAEEVDRALLANSIKKFLGIDTKTGNIILKPDFEKLTSRHKVLIFLLAIKAAALLKKINYEKVSPKYIIERTSIPSGTVHPKLKELKAEHLISQDEDSGDYFVPSHYILNATNDIKGGNYE